MRPSASIREIRAEDRRDIEEISRLIWDGEDYLPFIFEEWLEDGNFYGIEIEGKIVATGKITVLPGKVGWMEGLRVHPEYQGMGWGRAMHRFLTEKGMEMHAHGMIDALEYATCFKNEKSIALGLSTGFQIVRRYYGLTYHPGEKLIKPDTATLEDIDELEYEDYIPCGWKYIRKVPESLHFLQRRCHIYSLHGVKFLAVNEEHLVIVPFQPDVKSVEKILPALNYLGMEADISLIIPEEIGYEDYLPLGFEKWEKGNEGEMLLLHRTLPEPGKY